MKKPRFSQIVFLALITLFVSHPAHAELFVTKVSQGGGANWTAAIWSNPPNTTLTSPSAGNTYELVFNGTAWGNNTANTRIRNALLDGLLTFPGDSLTLHTNTDIRLKRANSGANNVNSAVSATILNFPGVGGNPGLILNGGILNPGDDNGFVVTGRIHVAGSGIIGDGDNGGGNEQRAFRAIHLRGILTGTGPITIVQGQPTNANMMSCDATGFSGNWVVQAGYLRGVTPGSLGTGNIFVTPTNGNAATIAQNFAVLELNYDISSPGTLVLSNHPTSGAPARMILHQNCTFSAVTINGTTLTAGPHPYAELAASFPSNFAPGGSGSLIVQPPAPPIAPTNVVAVGEDSKVTISWTAPANAAGYSVNRSSTSGGPYVEIGTTATTSFADTTVVNGSFYYYVIVATNSLGASPNSAEVVGNPNLPVTGITAVGGTNQIVLNWTALAGADSYTVRRATTSGGPYTNIASGVVATSYTDTSVLSGRTYFYRISAALAGGGTSGQSAEISATTAPGAPALSITLFASTVQRVAWTSDPVITGFSIEQSTDGVNFSPLATVGASSRSYTNGGLAPSTTYYYRIQASNATGVSDFSAVASNTTPAIGYNVNFQLGTAPIPPGYLKDIGDIYGDRTNGFFYGWTNIGGTNITVDARWRNNPSSPDLRYDTFIHTMRASTQNPALSSVWEFEIPNGFYSVRIVSGESDNFDGVYQFNVEGALTPVYTPTATARFGDMTIGVGVSDGRLTLNSGPAARNNKIAFIDIYPAVPTAPSFAAPLTNTVVEQNRPISLVANATGSAVLQYQWYFNDNPVMNGTNSSLFFARPQPGDSGNYYVVVTNYGGVATSAVATFTVTPDTEPPVVVSVASLDGWTIGVCFSEEIDVASGAAQEPSNYQVDGGNVTVLSVAYRPDGWAATLTLQQPVTGTVTLDVLDVPDHAANSAVSSTNVTSLGFTASDIGSPLLPGSHFTCDGNTIELVGGGADIWGAGDQGYLATRTISGDFDARIRVNELRGSNAITKAVLVARETTESGSAGIHLSVNPPPPGRNQIEMGLRPAFSNATVAVGSSFVPAGVPNAWMRVVRLGNTFTGYRSTNGTDWIQVGQTNVALASALQVGFGITAHDNSLLATGTVSGFSIAQTFPDLAINKSSPASVLRNSQFNYTISVTNQGVGAAAATAVSDSLPAGVSYVSALASQGSCSFAGGTVTCNLAAITNAGSATVTITVTATNSGLITNTAVVSTSSLDINTADNSATVVTEVTGQGQGPALVHASFSGGVFSGAFQSTAGFTYEVQWSHTVAPSIPCIDFNDCPRPLPPPVLEPWFTLTNIVGDGALKPFADPSPAPDRRFYRIIVH